MPVYQFYSELEAYQPKIWRRFQTSDDISMAGLGYTIMTMYEMRGRHLFDLEYEKPRLTPTGRYGRMELLCRYSLPEYMDDDFHACENVCAAKISDLDLEPPHRLLFQYDFGDSWTVSIIFEGELDIQDLKAKALPRVLEGNGWGIVEDCGGVSDLEELAEAFKKKRGDRYEELRNWLGVDEFDMEKFDVADMNARLKKLPGIYANIYEKKKMPTRKQIDLIERYSADSASKVGDNS